MVGTRHAQNAETSLSRTTKALPTECPACYGLGVTPQCAPTMELRYEQELHAHVEARTLDQGFGCLRCGGTGQIQK